MHFRIAIIVSSGMLAVAPASWAQRAVAAPVFAYASTPAGATATSTIHRQHPSEGQRNVLEMIADNLDFSAAQRSHLQSLLDRQQDSLVTLHQSTEANDEQKRLAFQKIRQQTKQEFVAMLTPAQKRAFADMTRRQ